MDLPNDVTEIIEGLKEKEGSGSVEVLQHKTRKTVYLVKCVTPTKIKRFTVDTNRPDIGVYSEEDRDENFDFICEM